MICNLFASSKPLHLRRAVISTTFLCGLIAVTPFVGAQTDSPMAFAEDSSGRTGAEIELPVATSAPVSSFSTSAGSLIAEATLPETPVPQRSGARSRTPAGTTTTEAVAPRTAGVIPPGMRGQTQTAHDKVALGVAELIDPEGLAAMFLSAGYEHVLNSEPNYGTDKGAFGERLGAAALREESQAVFNYMVFAPLLHEDARYYVEGPTYNPVHRTLYAVTRPLITRKDNGRNGINGALLLGYAASAALTPAYYPSSNRNFHDTASTFGSSIGGAALGFFVNEFTGDTLVALHLKRKP